MSTGVCIPGTQIILCNVCEDDAATCRDELLGAVCAECYGQHLPKATAALAEVGLYPNSK